MLTVKIIFMFCRNIIHFIEDKEANPWNGYMYAVALLLVSLTRALLGHHNAFVSFTTNLRIRNAMMSAIYNKVGGPVY